MAEIIVQEFISLDGVVQGPGAPEEDDENGFRHGGWSMDHDRTHDTADEGSTIIAEWESRTDALLLGRKTYDIWAGAWGVWDEDADGMMGEFTRRYNRVPKYVASRTPRTLTWQNSHQLDDDLPTAVAALKAERSGEIRVWGSADLVTTLGAHGLVDEYRLMIYPVVLGEGKRLFPAGFAPSTFRLAEGRVLGSGVIVAVYRAEG